MPRKTVPGVLRTSSGLGAAAVPSESRAASSRFASLAPFGRTAQSQSSVITSHARVALIVDQRNLDNLLAENCGDLAQLGY